MVVVFLGEEVALMPSPSQQSTSMSDEAVQRATGKDWAEWFDILDAAGAKDMPHPRIAIYLGEKHDLSGWWAQIVTVEYERARGLRDVHLKADGYSASVSKTLPIPLAHVYAAWADETVRLKWLPDTMTIRRANANKSLRITWHDNSSVEVNFYAKGDAKSQMVIQHNKLHNHDEVESLKSFWKQAVKRPEALLAAS